MPSLISIEASGLSGISDPDDETDPVDFFSAEQAEAHLRPNGVDLDWAGSFKQPEIDPGAIGNRNLPVFDGEGDATVKNGVALVESRPKSLRGQSVEIASMELSSGEAGIALSGPISVDADGLVDATLAMLSWTGQRSADAILGGIDAVKLRSSMTLFDAAADGHGVPAPFADCLAAFYGGAHDPATLARL